MTGKEVVPICIYPNLNSHHNPHMPLKACCLLKNPGGNVERVVEAYTAQMHYFDLFAGFIIIFYFY